MLFYMHIKIYIHRQVYLGLPVHIHLLVQYMITCCFIPLISSGMTRSTCIHLLVQQMLTCCFIPLISYSMTRSTCIHLLVQYILTCSFIPLISSGITRSTCDTSQHNIWPGLTSSTSIKNKNINFSFIPMRRAYSTSNQSKWRRLEKSLSL